MHITSFYASLLALFFVGLSVRTLLIRRKLRVAVGDAGNVQLLRASRVHANFAEYVPLSILLLGLCEAQGIATAVLHVAFASLVVARVAHAYGVSQVQEPFGFRVFGVAVTLSLLILSSAFLLVAFARTSVIF
jgi:uncharacterized membrane protein YecN with MAPEG domain